MPDRAVDLEQLAAECADAGHAGLAGWFAEQAEAEKGEDVPDRAVVGNKCGVTPLPHSWSDDYSECIRCGAKGPGAFSWEYGVPSDMGLPDPQPRAIVALSDDRQWLVVKPRVGSGFEANFAVYQIAPDAYRLEDYIPDTGQDAHEVLAAWLENNQKDNQGQS